MTPERPGRGYYLSDDGEKWFKIPSEAVVDDFPGEPLEEAQLRALRSINVHLRSVRSALAFLVAVTIVGIVGMFLWLTGVIEVGVKVKSGF